MRFIRRQFIGNEPFAVLLVMTLLNQRHRQTIDERLRRNRSFSHWCVQEVPESVTHRYGIIDPLEKESSLRGKTIC